MSLCGDREEIFIWTWKYFQVCEYRNAEMLRLHMRTTSIFFLSVFILFILLNHTITSAVLAAEENEKKKH